MLSGYLRERLAKSFESFERLCHQLVDYDGSLDAQLEAWLFAIGKSIELESWQALMQE